MVKGVLLDLGGVVYTGDSPLPGALDAISRLRAAGMPLRFATNVTSRSRKKLLTKLHRLEVAIEPQELLMPAIAARRYLEARQLKPFLLVAPALKEDFSGLGKRRPDAVVVGDARDGFTYAALNRAFRLIMGGAPLIALAGNRHYRDADGGLSLDAGAFVKTLEYAAGIESVMLGKPAPGFFTAGTENMGLAPGDVVMVGDDAEFDVAAAISAGLEGVLVKTGKYRPGVEKDVAPAPTAVVDDLASAADWILAHRDR